MKRFINKVASGSLTREESMEAFDLLFSGNATPSQIGGFLMALRVRGETVPEITGAVTTMRAKMIRVNAPANAVDVVGTGGDASGSYNISTLASFIVAGVGVPVAKHGNRALSSKSGAADCLTELGVNIDISADKVSESIHKAGIGFMFAPAHHPAMKNVGSTRVELGTRTIFNLLGPLSNPAGVTRQLIGVFSPAWLMPVAEVLKELGSTHVWVVHGDGLDEITGTGETQGVALENGILREFTLSPKDFNLPLCSHDDLKGGDAIENARALKAVLEGAKNAYRDVAVMNASAALIVAGVANTLTDAVILAEKSLASGAALECLNRLIKVSND
jgi:anthranilate phosphoribosyltransferase